ncbi:MAG: hypothetical protein PHI23_04025 [Candidatus Peribacteraceae bacterium]|nr:hypothetical protein [Candidatus Peribacteraceae bacterium]
MTRSSKIVWRIVAALTVLALVPLWLPLVLGVLGFYVDEPGWYVAKIVVQKSKPVSVCQKIISTPWNVLSPPTADQRALCIFDYARLTQDPSACELLMPSEYGWSCLGAVKSELGKGWGCGSTAENINCGAHDIYAKNLGISDCNIYKERVLQNWCYEERSAVLPGIDDCQKIPVEFPDWREECRGRYAFKQKDATPCKTITNEKRRAICEMEIDAWQKYSKNWSFARP